MPLPVLELQKNTIMSYATSVSVVLFGISLYEIHARDGVCLGFPLFQAV